MIGYILLIVLVVASCYLIHWGYKSNLDGLLGVGIVSAAIFIVLFFVATIHFGAKSSEARYFKENRDYYQEIVNSISDDMSPVTIAKIITTVEEANTKIEINRRHCNSKMWGFLYNKGIAEVKPIEIPKYKFSVEVEE